jgi:hypothetical protein
MPTASKVKSTAKKAVKSATPRKRTAYQEHMSKTLKEMKAQALKDGKAYDHKKAFAAAAAAWTANKK